MTDKRYKRGIIFILAITLLFLAIHGAIVVYIDPFFHYHAPLAKYYYQRPDTIERYANDGVARNFEFNALITGISVSNGFSTSEFDSLFGTKSEKIIYLGGTFKETGEGISRALRSNPDTQIVLCSLFLSKLYQSKDHRRSDVTDFPTYLYNDNYFDDIKYVFNKDVLFNYCYPMIKAQIKGEPGGVQSLDTKSYLTLNGYDVELTDGNWVKNDFAPLDHEILQPELTETETRNVKENVDQNIIAIAQKYPNTKMVYFVPPCSIYHYRQLYEDGSLLKTLQAEEIAISIMLEQENIEIYSFNDKTEIIENPYNYIDAVHYSGWISSYILEHIKNSEGRLTLENAEDFMQKEQDYLMNYDYLNM